MDVLTITYLFRFSDGTEKVFCENLKADSCEAIGRNVSHPPQWAALEYRQCSNCPLDPKAHAYCPVALDLVRPLEACRDWDLLDTVDLEISSGDRVVSLSTTVQRGLGSLIGLIIATGSCPHAMPFRPMARFHLPLAGEGETIYRVVSMYMMAQLFRAQQGESVDASLEGLYEIYRQLEMVNSGIAGRLKAAGGEESGIQPILEWDVFSGMFPLRTRDVLEQMKPLFQSYLNNQD